jgi:hypothetical protein
MRRHQRPALIESPGARLRRFALCPIALMLAAALAGCASPLPPARPTPAVFASRDARSQEFCALRAKARGYADTDMAVTCRREEYSAEARARSITINGDVDRSCEEVATYGGPNGPFSWSVYMDCIDDSI